jgi:cytochrome c biogenesis protein CcdA
MNRLAREGIAILCCLPAIYAIVAAITGSGLYRVVRETAFVEAFRRPDRFAFLATIAMGALVTVALVLPVFLWLVPDRGRRRRAPGAPGDGG